MNPSNIFCLSRNRVFVSAGLLLTLVLWAAEGPSAHGQVIVSGQVVDPGNTGVFNVDIDFFDSGDGSSIPISNDGTDPNGFFNVNSPIGTFDMWFYPPQGSGLAPAYLLNVTVSGNMNLGVVQVPIGYQVFGTVENSLGTALPNINIDVTELPSGTQLRLPADFTGPAGDWSFILAQGFYDFEFDPTKIYGATYAPGQYVNQEVNSATNLGILVLPQGHVLSGFVKAPGGSPVASADTDVRDIHTGQKLFTPDDNTDPLGFFSVVVPAGTWDVEIDPHKATKLAAKMVPQVVVNGATSIGTVTVPSGFYLEGTVTDSGGTPLQGVDIDVVVNGWDEVLTPGDDTNPSGFYRVVVPAGSYMVEFIPKPESGLAEIAVNPVSVTSDTVLDAKLPATGCIPPSGYGTGLAGTGGFVPRVGHAGGYPYLGNADFGVTVNKAVGGSPAYFFLGVNSASVPVFGGTLLVTLDLYFPISIQGTPGFPGGGGFMVPLPIPLDPGLANLDLYFQYIMLDAAAVKGKSMTNGLKITLCQ